MSIDTVAEEVNRLWESEPIGQILSESDMKLLEIDKPPLLTPAWIMLKEGDLPFVVNYRLQQPLNQYSNLPIFGSYEGLGKEERGTIFLAAILGVISNGDHRRLAYAISAQPLGPNQEPSIQLVSTFHLLGLNHYQEFVPKPST